MIDDAFSFLVHSDCIFACQQSIWNNYNCAAVWEFVLLLGKSLFWWWCILILSLPTNKIYGTKQQLRCCVRICTASCVNHYLGDGAFWFFFCLPTKFMKQNNNCADVWEFVLLLGKSLFWWWCILILFLPANKIYETKQQLRCCVRIYSVLLLLGKLHAGAFSLYSCHNKMCETTEQKLGALCEILYCLLNYMCILFWYGTCWFYIRQLDNMKQKPEPRCAALLCENLYCFCMVNPRFILTDNPWWCWCYASHGNMNQKQQQELQLLAVWEFVAKLLGKSCLVNPWCILSWCVHTCF